MERHGEAMWGKKPEAVLTAISINKRAYEALRDGAWAAFAAETAQWSCEHLKGLYECHGINEGEYGNHVWFALFSFEFETDAIFFKLRWFG